MFAQFRIWLKIIIDKFNIGRHFIFIKNVPHVFYITLPNYHKNVNKNFF